MTGAWQNYNLKLPGTSSHRSFRLEREYQQYFQHTSYKLQSQGKYGIIS